MSYIRSVILIATGSITYRIPIFVYLRVDTRAHSAISCHGLILVCSLKPGIFLFAIMHTLDNFRPHEGAFRDNAFQRHHMVEMGGT